MAWGSRIQARVANLDGFLDLAIGEYFGSQGRGPHPRSRGPPGHGVVEVMDFLAREGLLAKPSAPIWVADQLSSGVACWTGDQGAIQEERV